MHQHSHIAIDGDSGPVRRVVSRDFIAGACDIEPRSPGAISHDFARRHTAQTLGDRKRLGCAKSSRPTYPIDEHTHMQRLLRTEFNGGLVLGFIFGVFFTTVSLALSFPWWAPLVVWMVRP